MFIIGFNGPPGSGKTTFANETAKQLRRIGLTVGRESFAKPIKTFMEHCIGVPYAQINKCAFTPMFNKSSPREVLIALSEEFVKPRFGKDAFGNFMLARIENMETPVDCIVVDDCGFWEEVATVRDHHPFVLIRIYRPGFTFFGDSRGFVPGPDAVITNMDPLEYAFEQISEIIDVITDEVN